MRINPILCVLSASISALMSSCAPYPGGGVATEDPLGSHAYRGGLAQSVYEKVSIRFPSGFCAKKTLIRFQDEQNLPEVATDVFFLGDIPEGWDIAISNCGLGSSQEIEPWYSPVITLDADESADAATCYAKLTTLYGLAPAHLPHFTLKRERRACIYTSRGGVALLRVVSTPTSKRPTFEAHVTLWIKP